MFNKHGKEHPVSKAIRNPAIKNADVLAQFDGFLGSVGGIYQLSEAKRKTLLELAKLYSRFEVIARFAQILDVQRDRELLKDIIAYLALHHDSLRHQQNSNEVIANGIETDLGNLASCFLATLDRVKLTEKEMAEIKVKVLVQEAKTSEDKQKLYKEFLKDDTKVEELRALHTQLGYPTKLSPEKLEKQYSLYEPHEFTSSLAQGRLLDGYEANYHPFEPVAVAKRLTIILKIIGNNSALTKEYFSIVSYRPSGDNEFRSLAYLAVLDHNAPIINVMAKYIEDKDLLRSLFGDVKILFKEIYGITPKKFNNYAVANAIETLNALNQIFDDKTLTETLLESVTSLEIMHCIVVPFLSQPRFLPYIKEAASAKDKLGCNHLDRAIADGCEDVAMFLLKAGVTPTWFNFYRNRCGDEVYALLKSAYAQSFFPRDWEPSSYSEGIEDFARMHMNSKARQARIEHDGQAVQM